MPRYAATVTENGKIAIPAPLRRKFGVEPGTTALIVETDTRLEGRPLDARYFEQFAGVLSGEETATQTLLDDRRKEPE